MLQRSPYHIWEMAKIKTWHRTTGTEGTLVNPVWDLHAHTDGHNLPISEIQRPAKEQSRQWAELLLPLKLSCWCSSGRTYTSDPPEQYFKNTLQQPACSTTPTASVLSNLMHTFLQPVVQNQIKIAKKHQTAKKKIKKSHHHPSKISIFFWNS